MEFAAITRRAGSRNLFGTLMRFPERLFSINELAKTAGLPFATAWRTINEWEKVGIVETFMIGRSRAVKLRKGAVASKLSNLFSFESPHKTMLNVLRKMLAEEKGMKEAHLFGSVATGDETFESDIDVAILASKNYSPNALSIRFYEISRMKLVPLVFNSKEEVKEFIAGKKTVKLK